MSVSEEQNTVKMPLCTHGQELNGYCFQCGRLSIQTALALGVTHYSHAQGMPNPTTPFPTEVVFTIPQWKEVEGALLQLNIFISRLKEQHSVDLREVVEMAIEAQRQYTAKALTWNGGKEPQEPTPDSILREFREKKQTLCSECGKPEQDSCHMRYGNDLDNPVKHQFEKGVRK